MSHSNLVAERTWNSGAGFCQAGCHTDQAFALVAWKSCKIIELGRSGLLICIQILIQAKNTAALVMRKCKLQGLHQLVDTSSSAHEDQHIALLLLQQSSLVQH